MASLINAIIGATKQVDDQVIANQLLAGAKAAASAYLAATIESATPELRSLYGDSLNQILMSHSSITKIAIDKKWYQPYEVPKQQLVTAFQQSQTVVSPQA